LNNHVIPESAPYRLRRVVLDAQRGNAPPMMLDCAAHMLLYWGQPQMMREIALRHLLERFAATRVDLGAGSPYAPRHQACTVQRRTDCNVPDVLGVTWPNQHRCLQTIWQSKKAIFLDVRQDPVVDRLRPELDRLRTRVKLARRLEHCNRSFGIVCIDHTEEHRGWNSADQIYLDQFVVDFLSPIIAESRFREPSEYGALTAAERSVVRLAAHGLSYKEIAAALNKSPNTVDNQLRKIRKKFRVRNQVELARACADLL
jgi:DNA-binding CsgD family transcriptional regulator